MVLFHRSVGKSVNTALGICALVALTAVAGCFVDRSGLAGLERPGPRASCTLACEHGGVCVVTDCFCEPVDDTGPSCSEWIDDCVGVDCMNGDCLDQVRSSSCDCLEGWAIDQGGLCTVQLLSCETPNACIHGSCDDSSGQVVCVCEPGFEGTNCNVPVGRGSPPKGRPTPKLARSRAPSLAMSSSPAAGGALGRAATASPAKPMEPGKRPCSRVTTSTNVRSASGSATRSAPRAATTSTGRSSASAPTAGTAFTVTSSTERLEAVVVCR